MKCVGWLAVLVVAVGLGCQSSAMTAAKLYIKQEQSQKAQEQLALVLQTEPENSEAHLLMGKLLGEEGRYGEMAEHLAHAESDPKFQAEAEQTRRHFWAREYNAGVLHAQGEAPNYAMARHSFHNATLIDESALDAWRNLAYVYYQTDSTDAAIATYQKIAAADPEDESAFFSLGSLYLDEASRVLSEEVNDPENLNGLTNLAQAEDYLGKAIGALSQVVKINPENLNGQANLAIAQFNLGNLYWQWAQKIQETESTTATAASDTLSAASEIQEKYTAAKRAYEQVLQLKPDDEDALYNLAMVHLATEDMDGALPLLEQISEQMPCHALVWLHLGTVYAHKELLEKSEAAFARAEESIEYKVTGTAESVSLTYTNSQGGTEQRDSVSLPWSLCVAAVEIDAFLSISAQNQGETGSITVAIYRNNQPLKTATSEGSFVIATVSARIGEN